MSTTMMTCGHTGMATHAGAHDGLPANHPSCVIDAPNPAACTPAVAPNLDGRLAKCSCGKTRPSSTELAFFEWRGEGSRAAIMTCKQCSYYEIAHLRKNAGETANRYICDNFEPYGAFEFDLFYCGCRGWD
jgi:hypothetical protein